MFFKKHLRDRDFLLEVGRQSTLPGASALSLDNLLSRAIEAGAPAYYVELETVMRELRVMNAKGWREESSLRNSMWRELISKVLRLKDENPGLTMTAAVARVLSFETATSFFITKKHARNIFEQNIRHMTPATLPVDMPLRKRVAYLPTAIKNTKS